jgi:glyoxylase-like metal-dependent hydrolase (beta-lactamase superfamily II)
MIFEQIEVKGDRNFGYLIADELSRHAAIVDASYDPERMLARVEEHKLKVSFIISTHSHPDHVAGNRYLAVRTGAPELLHESTPHTCNLRVKDNDELKVGNLCLRFLHTPGHIPDHICVLTENKLLTGDILFVGKIGGTGPHFPASDPRQQWDSLQRLMRLDPSTEVWPGHNYGVRRWSTIGDEIATNPFLLSKTYDDFLYLKEHWAEYKKAHNIS